MDVFTPNTGQAKNLVSGEERAELRGWITKGGKHILIGEEGSSGGGGSTKKSVDKSGKSDIINFEENKKELESAIDDGKVKTKLDKDSQAKHKYGSAEYKKRIANGEFPSYTELSNMEVQKLINSYSRKGKVHKGKDGQFREVIECDSNFGMFGDRKTRTYIPTHRGTIHYSNKGTHLVPAAPIEGD